MTLLEQFRGVCAVRHFSPRTVECYQMWIRQFLQYFRGRDGTWRHPRQLRGAEVAAFLIDLAQRRRLSASSQNQALNAIVFLYKQVLAAELGDDHLGPINAARVRRPAKMPTVLSVAEVERVIAAVPPNRRLHGLMVQVLYGCGLRLMECCTLRIRDVDFDRAQIIVREGKGGKDRIVMLPQKPPGAADVPEALGASTRRAGGPRGAPDIREALRASARSRAIAGPAAAGALPEIPRKALPQAA
jgi:site-specific recombinase XerD